MQKNIYNYFRKYKISKKALVDLMGGLGNQLHQISFAKYLENKGYIVQLNEDWYNNFDFSEDVKYRELNINANHFGLIKSTTRYKNKYYKLRKLSESALCRKIYHSNINSFYKTFEGDVYSENKDYSYNRYIGYWQNPKYFKDNREFLLDGLKKHTNFEPNNSINSIRTLIHIRQGDYIKWNENLPIKYYEKALSGLREYENVANYDIFTDIEKIDYRISLFNNAENIYNNISENPMITFSNMKNYKNYIISNSSFSMFAAFLGSSDKSLVFYPDPWFKSIKHTPYVGINWYPVKY